MEADKLLDTEVIMSVNEPLILGFPSNGNTYFLSVFISGNGSDSLLHGEVLKLEARPELIFPTEPVYRLEPEYPAICIEKRIQGSVIVEVSIDEEGRVTETRVLKSANRDLDFAALAALKQWRYEPYIENKKAVSAVFAVSVNFKLREADLTREIVIYCS